MNLVLVGDSIRMGYQKHVEEQAFRVCAAGVPARRIRDLTPKEQAEIAWSASHYCDLAASYRRADLERGS